MINIACVVVLYNPQEDVIDNILSYSDKVQKIYLVDNSEQHSHLQDLLLKKINNSIYISLGENKGIAYALNVGVKKAIEDKFSWLLTMDQDSSMYNDIVSIYSKCIKYTDTSSVAILSPQYDTPRSKVEHNCNVVELYWTMQSANLINLNLIDSIGFFEEKYFIDCVDYEFCLRARRNGFKILRCNEAILKHSPAINKKFLMLNYGYASPLRVYYQVRNACDMFNKYHNIRSLVIILIRFVKIILLFDKKIKFLNAFFCAFSDYYNNRFGKKIIR